jgi:hypothetical protein
MRWSTGYVDPHFAFERVEAGLPAYEALGMRLLGSCYRAGYLM